MKDFRYQLNGSEVEAFQMTPGMRYREKDWPEWFSSKYFMTVDDTEWLNINDQESQIPELGWIVRGPDGVIRAEGWEAMEGAEKLVEDPPPVVHPAADEKPGLSLVQAAPADDSDMSNVYTAYELLLHDEIDAAKFELRNMLSKSTEWCSCSPGHCEGNVSRWSCRQESPLAK